MSAAQLDQIQKKLDTLTAQVAALVKAAKQPDRKAFKPSEVAAMLGVSDQTVRELIHDGQLEAVLMNGWYLISVGAVDRLLANERRVSA